jgi:hypothetical protein
MSSQRGGIAPRVSARQGSRKKASEEKDKESPQDHGPDGPGHSLPQQDVESNAHLTRQVAELTALVRQMAAQPLQPGVMPAAGVTPTPSAPASVDLEQTKSQKKRAKKKVAKEGRDLLGAIGDALGGGVPPALEGKESEDSDSEAESVSWPGNGGAWGSRGQPSQAQLFRMFQQSFGGEARRPRREAQQLWGEQVLEKIHESSPTCTGFVRDHVWASARTKKEAGAIARGVDLLLDEGVPVSTSKGLNHLLLRLAAIERADRTGNWDIVESITNSDPSLGIVPDEMLDGIAKHLARMKKVKTLGKGKE